MRRSGKELPSYYSSNSVRAISSSTKLTQTNNPKIAPKQNVSQPKVSGKQCLKKLNKSKGNISDIKNSYTISDFENIVEGEKGTEIDLRDVENISQTFNKMNMRSKNIIYDRAKKSNKFSIAVVNREVRGSPREETESVFEGSPIRLPNSSITTVKGGIMREGESELLCGGFPYSQTLADPYLFSEGGEELKGRKYILRGCKQGGRRNTLDSLAGGIHHGDDSYGVITQIKMLFLDIKGKTANGNNASIFWQKTHLQNKFEVYIYIYIINIEIH